MTTRRPLRAAAALTLASALALTGCSSETAGPDSPRDTAKFPSKSTGGQVTDPADDPAVQVEALGDGWKVTKEPAVEATLCDASFLPGGNKTTVTDPDGRRITIGFTEVANASQFVTDTEERFVKCSVYANDTTQFFAFTTSAKEFDGELTTGTAGLIAATDVATEEYISGGFATATGPANRGEWVVTVEIAALDSDNPDDALLVLYADKIAANQVAANTGDATAVPAVADLSWPERPSEGGDFEVPPVSDDLVEIDPDWDTEGW